MLSSTKIKYLGVAGTFIIISTSYLLHAKTFYNELYKVAEKDRIVSKPQKKSTIQPKTENKFIHVVKKTPLVVEQNKTVMLTASEKIEKLLKEHRYIHVEKSGELTESSKEVLDKILPLLSDINDSYIEIEGYSASQMYDHLTKKISQELAQSVYDYIKNKKIDCELVITGYGDLYPIIDDKKDERNSRVELKVRRR